jgi:hypothetical protein
MRTPRLGSVAALQSANEKRSNPRDDFVIEFELLLSSTPDRPERAEIVLSLYRSEPGHHFMRSSVLGTRYLLISQSAVDDVVGSHGGELADSK